MTKLEQIDRRGALFAPPVDENDVSIRVWAVNKLRPSPVRQACSRVPRGCKCGVLVIYSLLMINKKRRDEDAESTVVVSFVLVYANCIGEGSVKSIV